MKKLIAVLMTIVFALALTTTAFAATYNYDNDITFEYDETHFEITMDDHTDDEDLVILTGKNDAWGDTFVRIHLADLDDGEHFPTAEEFTPLADVEVTQGEWAGYQNVFMYTIEDEDGTSDHFFIAPVVDDDREVDNILTVEICVSRIDDEEAAMLRDDLISEVVDSLKVDD